jgi:hypothetical protein
VFPRELILLARALVHLEATAALVDAHLSLTDLLGPLLPELRSTLLPGKAEREELWSSAAMDFLALATELPAALPHLIDRLLLAAAEPPPAATSPRAAKSALTRSVISASAAALLGAAAASGLTSWRNRRHRRR